MKRWENRRKWSAVGGAFGEALDTLESKGVLKQLLSVVGLVLVDLYLLGSDVGPLWSQGLEAISVSYDALGKTGIYRHLTKSYLF